MAKWLLIDGSNLTFRSYYAIPELTRKDGFPTNALHGWLRTLWYLEDREKPDQIVVFFDKGKSVHRGELMAEYKANRARMPEPLRVQVPWIKELTESLGYRLVEEEGVEADDLIASAALKLRQEGHDAYIVSADKDLAQCLGPGIFQLLPPPTANPKLGWRVLDREGVQKKFGVNPEQIVDYLALIGDSSDNIPGLPGVGPKTAAKWIEEYGSVEGVLNKANYIMPKRFQMIIPENKDLLRLNLKMIKLKMDLDPGPLEQLKADPEKVLEILESMEMRTAARDARKRLGIEEG